MILLGIETSTPLSSVALGDESGPIAGTSMARGRGHVEFLMPAIRSLCEQAGVPIGRLGGVAVGIGPGLFTGMRVGIATAKTVAHLLRVPLVGISGLDVLAFGVRHSPRLICAAIDAKRGEVFSALYRQAPGGVERMDEYRAWTAEALAGELTGRRAEVLFVGNGAFAYRATLERVDRSEFSAGTQYPSAEHLVELAAPRISREELAPPALLEPLYVRRSDAEIRWEERGVVIERPLRVKVPKRALGGRAAR